MNFHEHSFPRSFNSATDVRLGCKVIQESFMKLREEVSKSVIGHQRVVDITLVSIFAGGHVLLEGAPGLGKTLLVRTLGDVLELSTSRIQCTADLMPADIVGTTVVDVDERTHARSFNFRQGPVFHNLILVDEINRATPKCQSALLESMQEHSVSLDGKTYRLPEPFFVLATQNPIEQEGTYPLPEAQLDRFLLKIDVGYSSREDLNLILEATTSSENQQPSTVLNKEFLLQAQSFLKGVCIASHVQDYVTRLVLAMQPYGQFAPSWVPDLIRTGASPRAAQAIVACAKVAAVVDGRYAVSHKDVAAVAVPALQHRIVRTFEAEAGGIESGAIIQRIINSTPAYVSGDRDV